MKKSAIFLLLILFIASIIYRVKYKTSIGLGIAISAIFFVFTLLLIKKGFN